jgi:hypothetical protein
MGSPMVEDKFKQAQSYRDRAERLRGIAAGLGQQTERELLMQLAMEYEQMAQSAATIAMTEVARATGNSEETHR